MVDSTVSVSSPRCLRAGGLAVFLQIRNRCPQKREPLLAFGDFLLLAFATIWPPSALGAVPFGGGLGGLIEPTSRPDPCVKRRGSRMFVCCVTDRDRRGDARVGKQGRMSVPAGVGMVPAGVGMSRRQPNLARSELRNSSQCVMLKVKAQLRCVALQTEKTKSKNRKKTERTASHDWNASFKVPSRGISGGFSRRFPPAVSFLPAVSSDGFLPAVPDGQTRQTSTSRTRSLGSRRFLLARHLSPISVWRASSFLPL